MSDALPLTAFVYRAPRDAEFDGRGDIAFALFAEPKVQRMAFDIDPPVRIGSYDTLEFSLWSPDHSTLTPSLITGDRGFPEIRMTTREGAIFRFKRGNIKDFINLSALEQKEPVRIPLKSFAYDTDIKQDAPSDTAFLDSEIVKVDFDFLANPERETQIALSTPQLTRDTAEIAEPLDSFVEITPTWRNAHVPAHASFSGAISLRIEVTRARAGGPSSVDGHVEATSPSGEQIAYDVKAGAAPGHVSVATFEPGVHQLCFRLKDAETGRALPEKTIEVIRAFETPPGETRRTILGLNDTWQPERAAALSGRYYRRIFPLSTFDVIETDGKFRYKINQERNTLPYSAPRGGHRVIAAIKHMHPYLTPKPIKPDHYRRPPENWRRYQDCLRVLARHMAAHGVHAVEAWNEASVIYEWIAGMKDLVTLHRMTYEAFKEEAPEIKVLGCCTHTIHLDFVQQFLDAGGADHCDGFALHGYTYAPDRIADDLARLDALLARHEAATGAAPIEVYFTETGFRIPTFSALEQARHLVAFSLLAATYDRIKSFIWFRFQNQPTRAGDYNQAISEGYAMVAGDDSFTRPAFGAYQFTNWFLDLFAGGQSERIDENGDTLLTFQRDTRNGRALIRGQTADIRPVRAQPGEIACDMFGRILAEDEIDHTQIILFAPENLRRALV
ncbi:MAG: hypothetical protein AAGJ87_07495 [Pseudomonadota bacterium]